MNRINPLHTIVLLSVVLIFFIYKLNLAKDELSQVKEQYRETLLLTTKLSGLNDAYFNENQIKRSIEKILQQPSIKSAGISQKTTDSSIVLSSGSVSKTVINSLMGNFLNGSYNIVSFQINSINSNSASFELEIRW